MKILKHTCTLDCADCCTLEIHINGEKIVKISGDKEHPYTQGLACKKALAHFERLKHEKRILSPLLKINGEWKEITFEKALEMMDAKLKLYKEEYSAKSVFYYEQYGNGGLSKSIGEVFFNFYGGVSKTKGGPCWSAGMKGQKLDFGDARSNSLEDMLNSKSIFIWGKNPANTSIHTIKMIKKAKDKGVKIIVIDPIFTDSAKFADKYVRIKPGTDYILALAMANIIITEKIYDVNYIKDYVLGFDEYKNYVMNLNIDNLCYKCGISKREVKELVNIYTNKYSTILLGYGMQKYKNGGNTVRIIDSLAAITGQIGFEGGGVNYANKVYPSIINTDPYNSAEKAKDREFYVSNISEFIKDNSDSNNNENTKIKMAVIVKSNLLNQLPNLNELEKYFSEIEFKVCFDMFMTDTAQVCDLIIPCTNPLESEDLIYSSMNNPYISYNEEIIAPRNYLMDEYYFFMELAKRLKIEGYPLVDKKEYLSKVIEPLKAFNENISLEWIKETPFTIDNNIAWEDKKFATKSGKFEIISFKELDYNFEDKNDSKYEKNKFRLLTNHYRDSLSSQHFIDKDGIAQGYINENMAKIVTVSHKEIVTLKSENGVIRVQLNIDNRISDNVIMMYVGWWKKHGNPNYLTDSGISDIGGQITYNETFVEVII